ncbi:MAG: hypothetical protein M1829_001015 [Trizodia sp. TS-e1964]|nr:MAG: hypothetical protein M1829_001015 [Trizodia sp. TS-e1964]
MVSTSIRNLLVACLLFGSLGTALKPGSTVKVRMGCQGTIKVNRKQVHYLGKPVLVDTATPGKAVIEAGYGDDVLNCAVKSTCVIDLYGDVYPEVNEVKHVILSLYNDNCLRDEGMIPKKNGVA